MASHKKVSGQHILQNIHRPHREKPAAKHVIRCKCSLSWVNAAGWVRVGPTACMQAAILAQRESASVKATPRHSTHPQRRCVVRRLPGIVGTRLAGAESIPLLPCRVLLLSSIHGYTLLGSLFSLFGALYERNTPLTPSILCREHYAHIPSIFNSHFSEMRRKLRLLLMRRGFI